MGLHKLKKPLKRLITHTNHTCYGTNWLWQCGFLLAFLFSLNAANANKIENHSKSFDLQAFAIDFATAAKTSDWEAIKRLKSLGESFTLEQLKVNLSSDIARKAFWINMYNGLVIVHYHEAPQQYTNKSVFFNTSVWTIADRAFSLNDIEHRILRKGQHPYGMGYLKNPIQNNALTPLELDYYDCRIHFALNCGAKSCPPFLYYDYNNIYNQLDIATANFLRQEVHFDSLTNTLTLPAIMYWYNGDFGGKNGILNILNRYKLLPIPQPTHLRWRKKPYNWDPIYH